MPKPCPTQHRPIHVLHGRIRQLSQLEEIRAELQRVELSAVPDARAVNSAYVGRVQPSGSETWNAVPVGLELRDLVHHAEELRGAGGLPDAEQKIWHAHPVWFLNGNPIVGYSKLKECVRLLFWSGQSFDEPGLQKEGSFKAAEKRRQPLALRAA